MTEGSQDEVVDENLDIELRSTSTTTFGYVRVDNSSYTNDKYTNAILFNLLKKPPKILTMRCEREETADVWWANSQPEEMSRFQGGGHGARNL